MKATKEKKIKMREYQKAHREKYREYQKKYYEEHREYYKDYYKNRYKTYSKRIEKAIEQIKIDKSCIDEDDVMQDTLDDLLDILKGSDKE